MAETSCGAAAPVRAVRRRRATEPARCGLPAGGEGHTTDACRDLLPRGTHREPDRLAVRPDAGAATGERDERRRDEPVAEDPRSRAEAEYLLRDARRGMARHRKPRPGRQMLADIGEHVGGLQRRRPPPPRVDEVRCRNVEAGISERPAVPRGLVRNADHAGRQRDQRQQPRRLGAGGRAVGRRVRSPARRDPRTGEGAERRDDGRCHYHPASPQVHAPKDTGRPYGSKCTTSKSNRSTSRSAIRDRWHATAVASTHRSAPMPWTGRRRTKGSSGTMSRISSA